MTVIHITIYVLECNSFKRLYFEQEGRIMKHSTHKARNISELKESVKKVG